MYRIEKRHGSFRLCLHTNDPFILRTEQWLLATFGAITGLRLSYVASNLVSPTWCKTTNISRLAPLDDVPAFASLFCFHEGKCGAGWNPRETRKRAILRIRKKIRIVQEAPDKRRHTHRNAQKKSRHGDPTRSHTTDASLIVLLLLLVSHSTVLFLLGPFSHMTQ